jgi:hypothetical protein
MPHDTLGVLEDIRDAAQYIADDTAGMTFADTEKSGYAYRYLGFAEALEALFGRPVDLLTERSIRNPSFRQAVEATRRPIYAGRGASSDST